MDTSGPVSSVSGYRDTSHCAACDRVNHHLHLLLLPALAADPPIDSNLVWQQFVPQQRQWINYQIPRRAESQLRGVESVES